MDGMSTVALALFLTKVAWLIGTVRIPAMSIGRSDGMSITIPGDVDNVLGAKRRR
jgi:hypothetical protein